MFVSLHCHQSPDWNARGGCEAGRPTTETVGFWWPGSVHPNWRPNWDARTDQVPNAVLLADEYVIFI